MNNKGNVLAGIGIALLVIVAFFGIVALMAAGMYNGLVTKDVAVEKSWANVQTAYERRLDLIPNLVNAVKGVMNFEKDTQTEIAALRSGIKNAKTTSDIDAVSNRMNSMVSDLIVNVEAYPNLKSSDNFLALQDELAGTENRIKWERDNFNEQVRSYKTSVRTFPTNIIAGMFGFDADKYTMFEAQQGADKAVEVSFE